MKIQLPIIYSQKDPRWGGMLLGFNTEPNYTIAGWGCLITCLAMIGNYYGYKKNPLEINDTLKKVGGFVSGGLYVWGAITRTFSNVSEVLIRIGEKPLTDNHIEQIKNSIDSGYPVMLHIDFNPKTGYDDMHWVVCIGYSPSDENDFTIVDPIDGKEKSLKKYLGWFRLSARNTIIDYCIYSGKVEKPIECDCKGYEAQVATLTERLVGLETNYSNFKEAADITLKVKTDELDKLQINYDKLQTKYTKETDNLLERLLKLEGQVKIKDARISELVQASLSHDFSQTELLSMFIKKIDLGGIFGRLVDTLKGVTKRG